MLKSEILENYLATLKIDSVILNQYHQVPPTWQDYDVCENY
ncbi:hypothetical protein [Vallitalea pronyensis]|nr:hypothetical protein [Vallitalea pronyensis]